MTETPKLYIAGMGMITPVGGNVAMTVAAVEAGISGYRASDFINSKGNPATLALVPRQLFADMQVNIGEGDRFNEQHDRIIRMAIGAIQEACCYCEIETSIPLVLAMPDTHRDLSGLVSFTQSLAENCAPMIDINLTRSIYSGRAAGIEAIDFAFKYLLDFAANFILIGGSDCHIDDEYLYKLDREKRLLAVDNPDGFAPGEGAGFILLTRHPELAQVRNGKMIAINKPGVAEEKGHLSSEDVYRGDGLDQAFKSALINHHEQKIQTIYSSMNGENFWAKEMGVAQVRNRKSFKENVTIRHPADCYGDLGAATATTLISLAAENLFKNKKINSHLVYASSDTSKRGAIVVEKLNAITVN